MKGEGDGERNKIFANAFGQDPEFFAFYRAMQAYEKALIGGETSLILSPDSEFFKFFGNIKPKNRVKFYERIDHCIWSILIYRRYFVCHISIKNEKYAKKIRINK